MIYVLRVKEGVTFAAVSGPYRGTIAPAGFAILATFQHVAQVIEHDITITSGSDGAHSGPDDPHHWGEAYDCRTHDLPDKQVALEAMKDFAGPLFFFWIEDEDGPNEHIHGQRKKGTVYPPVEPNNHDAVQEATS